MSKEKESIKATTVSVDATARDRINEEAERLGLSQRQMIQRILEIYENQLIRDSKDSENVGGSDMVSKVCDSLEKVLKRDDRVVAFIKEQEKVLLNPILNTVHAIDANLNQLVEILSNIK